MRVWPKVGSCRMSKWLLSMNFPWCICHSRGGTYVLLRKYMGVLKPQPVLPVCPRKAVVKCLCLHTASCHWRGMVWWKPLKIKRQPHGLKHLHSTWLNCNSEEMHAQENSMTETAFVFPSQGSNGMQWEKERARQCFHSWIQMRSQGNQEHRFFFLTGRGHQCREVVPEQSSKSRNTFLKALEIQKQTPAASTMGAQGTRKQFEVIQENGVQRSRPCSQCCPRITYRFQELGPFSYYSFWMRVRWLY